MHKMEQEALTPLGGDSILAISGTIKDETQRCFRGVTVTGSLGFTYIKNNIFQPIAKNLSETNGSNIISSNETTYNFRMGALKLSEIPPAHWALSKNIH